MSLYYDAKSGDLEGLNPGDTTVTITPSNHSGIRLPEGVDIQPPGKWDVSKTLKPGESATFIVRRRFLWIFKRSVAYTVITNVSDQPLTIYPFQ